MYASQHSSQMSGPLARMSLRSPHQSQRFSFIAGFRI